MEPVYQLSGGRPLPENAWAKHKHPLAGRSGLLGENDVSRYLDAIPPAQMLQRGLSLCENLDLLPGQQRAMPGRFIPPPALARQNALRVQTHRQMRNVKGKVAGGSACGRKIIGNCIRK